MRTEAFIRIISIILIVFIFFGAIPSFAAIYSPGPISYELDRNNLLDSNNVSLSENKIVFSADGSIQFDLILPFDSDSVTFIYETVSENVILSIVTDKHSYTTTLESNSNIKTISITELYGSNTITFTVDKAVTVTSINFGKVNEKYNEINSVDIPLTDYERAVLTSVIFKDDASVVKVRGAIQHLDIKNINLTPMNIDGRLYVPFEKFAQSLGYYSEHYPDRAYLYMTGETQSLSLIGGKGYIESDDGGKREFSIKVAYDENVAFVPVRALSEALGFSVQYKDGFVVIDDRLTAKKVIDDKDIFETLNEEFKQYIPKVTTLGKTYHVSQNSSAQNPVGTESSPFKTLAQACAVAKAGDIVIVHEGTYREVLKPQNDGSFFAPITFKAAEGEKVVISALEKISNFTTFKGDILSAYVSKDLGFGRNQLFYKGEALNQGRHPNSDTKPGVVPYPKDVPEGLYATRGNIRITEAGGNIAYSDIDLNQDQTDYWKGGTFVTLKGQGWSLVSGEITASAKGQLTLKDHDGTKSYNLGLVGSPSHNGTKYFTKVHDSDYGYITNHLNTVDVPGEWYMNSSVVFMIPPKGADLSNDFEIKQRQLCIDLRNRKYVKIEGIDTIGGGITMSGDETEGCVLDGGEFKYIAHHTVLLDQSNYAMTANEQLNSLISIKSGEAGVCVAGENNAIVNSKIDYSSASGITLLGKYHYINNNIIGNTAYSGAYPGGIRVMPDISKGIACENELIGGHFITYNTLYNAGRSLLLLGSTVNGKVIGVSPIEIAYNRFYNGGLTSRDTGITYEYGFTGGNDKSKTRMHHNFLYNPGYKDPDTESMLMMLYHDGYAAARDTYCNVTYYEEKDKAPANQVYVQNAAYTVIRNRNNSEVGYLPYGEDELTKTDFPGGRFFEPGANHDQYPRNEENLSELKNGDNTYYPSSKTQDSKKYTFENVVIEDNKRTEVGVYMTRELGVKGAFTVKANVYNESGALLQTTQYLNMAETEKFYVYELHKGLAVINPLSAGTYKLELEFPDSTIDVKRIVLDSFDPKYDNLYSKQDEESGKVAYLPASAQESGGKEIVTFENVYFKANEKTILDLNMTRDFGKEDVVNMTAEVYNSQGTLVKTAELANNLAHSQYNIYEALSGKVVIPELSESGNYRVVFKLSDTYSKALRLITKPAGTAYDNLFNENVFLGGSFNSFSHVSPATSYDVSRYSDNTPEKIAKYLHYTAGDCRSHTITYKDRNIVNDAEYLRITLSSDSIHCGGTVELYVDRSYGTPIATFNTYDTSWLPRTKYFKLDSKLTAGKHTFYLKFKGIGKCATLWNFSFCNEAWSGETLDGIN